MADITLSKAVRSNLLNLQSTADLLGTTQERLATGKKVNSALDNPTNFFTASSLNSRASDMGSLLDSMANGIQTLEAADNGLTAITKNLESMQSTLTQARQDKSFQTKSFMLDAAASGNLSFSGGAVGETAVDIALDGGAAAKAGSQTTGAFESFAIDAGGAAGTAGIAEITYAGSAIAYGAADTTTFDIDVDNNGAAQSITINQAGVQAVGNGDSTIDSIDELQEILENAFTAAGGAAANLTLSNDGTDITITSSTTGTDSIVAITNFAGDGDGGAATNTGSGIANTAGTAGTDDTRDLLTFDIAVDGGAASSVTIDAALVAGVGNNDQVIDDIDEYQAVVQAALDAAGVTGVTVSNDGTGLKFTSDTKGATSAVAITNVNANDGAGGTAFTAADAGLDALTTDAGGATGGARTVDELVAAINDSASLDGKIRASNDNGKLRVENLSTQTLTVTGYNSTNSKVDGGAGTTEIGGNTRRADLAAQFNELRDQLDKLADDASFNGVNLLRGDNLQLTFNETGTSEINIQTKEGKAINSANLGVSTTLTAEELDSDTAIDGFLADIKGALGSVRSQSSSFGSNLSVVQNRQDFTKNMINTLETGASNLTLADTNEEAANLLALQTRQQLSSTALSLASQADQNVLRLF